MWKIRALVAFIVVGIVGGIGWNVRHPDPEPLAIPYGEITIEPRFSGSGEIKAARELAYRAAMLVRANGYRCDSAFSFYRFQFSAGFTLRCNEGRYVYEIADRGGRWQVTVK